MTRAAVWLRFRYEPNDWGEVSKYLNWLTDERYWNEHIHTKRSGNNKVGVNESEDFRVGREEIEIETVWFIDLDEVKFPFVWRLLWYDVCREKVRVCANIWRGFGFSFWFECYFDSHHTSWWKIHESQSAPSVCESSWDELVIIYWYQTGRDDWESLWWMGVSNFEHSTFSIEMKCQTQLTIHEMGFNFPLRSKLLRSKLEKSRHRLLNVSLWVFGFRFLEEKSFLSDPRSRTHTNRKT